MSTMTDSKIMINLITNIEFYRDELVSDYIDRVCLAVYHDKGVRLRFLYVLKKFMMNIAT